MSWSIGPANVSIGLGTCPLNQLRGGYGKAQHYNVCVCMHVHVCVCVCVQLDLNPGGISLMKAGACGAFVHGLEDEFMGMKSFVIVYLEVVTCMLFLLLTLMCFLYPPRTLNLSLSRPIFPFFDTVFLPQHFHLKNNNILFILSTLPLPFLFTNMSPFLTFIPSFHFTHSSLSHVLIQLCTPLPSISHNTPCYPLPTPFKQTHSFTHSIPLYLLL